MKSGAPKVGMNMKADIDFLFIGPSKTASTWLYKALDGSPEVFIPAAKDLQFFDLNYNKGIDWYYSFFKKSAGRLTGELSHDYILRSNESMARISRHLPNVKLICCVRDPFERALSGLRFLQRNGLVSENASIEQSCVKWPELIEGGEYHANLKHVLQYVPRERLLILNFDALKDDPQSFLKEVFDFLGVPYADTAVVRQKVNASAIPRSSIISKVVKIAALAIRRAGMPGIVGRIKTNKVVTSVLYKPHGRASTLSQGDAQFLLKCFREDLYKLEDDFDIPTKLWTERARQMAQVDCEGSE